MFTVQCFCHLSPVSCLLSLVSCLLSLVSCLSVTKSPSHQSPVSPTHSSTHSKISPGWQFNISQMASSVLNRMALAFPVFRIERFAGVIPTRSESSFKEILFFAISTSKFTIMGMIIGDLRFTIYYDLRFLGIVDN